MGFFEAFNRRSVLDYFVFLAVLVAWVKGFASLVDLSTWSAWVVVLTGLCVAGTAPDMLRKKAKDWRSGRRRLPNKNT